MNILEVTEEELRQLLSFSKKGIIELDGVPHEITLSEDGSFKFTGTSWKWGESTVPSSHQDYEIKADHLNKENSTPALFPVNQKSYSFYPSIDDFLDSGN